MAHSVSVILALYKSPWLVEALESVRAQTHEEWELLVMDDANSDEDRERVLQLADPRIRYLPNEKPLGPSSNHQRGIDEATYRFVAFLNHDDLWHPSLLAKLTAAMATHPRAALSFADHWVMDEGGDVDHEASERYSTMFHRKGLAPGFHERIEEMAIVHRTIPIAQCAVMDKESIPHLPRWVGGAYDFYIASQIAAAGRGAVYVPERLAYFREHTSNLGLRRSAARDIAAARIYASAARQTSGDTAAYAWRKALECLALVPRSMLRGAHQRARGRRPRPRRDITER